VSARTAETEATVAGPVARVRESQVGHGGYSKVALDAALGLLLLAAYIIAIVGLAAGVTYAVIKIFPTERTPKDGEKADKPEKPEESPDNGAPSAGSLFRRSKRGKT
jgi:hypothetical protein